MVDNINNPTEVKRRQELMDHSSPRWYHFEERFRWGIRRWIRGKGFRRKQASMPSLNLGVNMPKMPSYLPR